MMVNYPLSRGLGNIAKVYLITCSQSMCAKLKKYEFCPVGHSEIAHIYIYVHLFAFCFDFMLVIIDITCITDAVYKYQF